MRVLPLSIHAALSLSFSRITGPGPARARAISRVSVNQLFGGSRGERAAPSRAPLALIIIRR